MIEQETIHKRIKAKLNRVLLVAETALPESQFKAYRKFVLDEFGDKELEMLFNTNTDRNGTGRNILRKGRGAS